MRTLPLLLLLGGCVPELPWPTADREGHDFDGDGFAELDGDCNDEDASVHPDATEVCDQIDNDCGGDGDEDAVDRATWYEDADGDGDGDPGKSHLACTQPPGMVSEGSDCVDSDDDIGPDAPETVADGVDQDCDGVDDCYSDTDGDGFGVVPATPDDGLNCDDLGMEGTTSKPGDCADGDAQIHPDGEEVVGNGVDEDCDTFDDCYQDADEDGFGGVLVVTDDDLDCDNDSTEYTTSLGERTGQTDCDDQADDAYPEAEEVVGDGVDQDCDGSDLCYEDADDDGHGTAWLLADDNLDCDDDSTASTASKLGDCDDSLGNVHPDAAEVVGDGVDQDCDEGDTCFEDLDGDGFGEGSPTLADDNLDCMDGSTAHTSDASGDCDDLSAARTPEAKEIAGDGVDQDCDGGDLCYEDLDGDGWGTAIPVEDDNLVCDDDSVPSTASVGSGSGDGDCDDSSVDVHPTAVDTPGDGVDQDCDGVDVCYIDADADGYGTVGLVLDDDTACTNDSTAGTASVSGDCDDQDPLVTLPLLWYRDRDHDGFGAYVLADSACVPPKFASTEYGDCDDGSALVHPDGIEEIGDGIDQDCDGFDDCFVDVDEDGFGTDVVATDDDVDCENDSLPQMAGVSGDCDDTSTFAHPAAPEIVGDGVDQDCDDFDNCFEDLDGDGFGTDTTRTDDNLLCTDDSMQNTAAQSGDCNDTDLSVNPGEDEVAADGVDQDCVGGDACFQDLDGDGFGSEVVVDDDDLDCENDSTPSTSATGGDCADDDPNVYPVFAYVDGDLDTYGDMYLDMELVCPIAAGHADRGGDCDDTLDSTFLGSTEICGDSEDNDCDGLVDYCEIVGPVHPETAGQNVFTSDGWLYYLEPKSGLKRVPPGGGDTELVVDLASVSPTTTMTGTPYVDEDDTVLFDAGNAILRFDPGTEEVSTVFPVAGTIAWWIRQNPVSNLIMDRRGTLITGNTTQVAQADGTVLTRSHLRDFNVLTDEFLFGHESYSAEVWRLRHDGSAAAQWGAGVSYASVGLAMAQDGALFLARPSYPYSWVDRIPPAGGEAAPFVLVELRISSLAAGPNGRLYVFGEEDTGVWELNPDNGDLTLYGCDPPDYACAEDDADHDGFGLPSDCDDADPWVNPQQVEYCEDDEDNDCDGSVDAGCLGISGPPPGYLGGQNVTDSDGGVYYYAARRGMFRVAPDRSTELVVETMTYGNDFGSGSPLVELTGTVLLDHQEGINQWGLRRYDPDAASLTEVVVFPYVQGGSGEYSNLLLDSTGAVFAGASQIVAYPEGSFWHLDPLRTYTVIDDDYTYTAAQDGTIYRQDHDGGHRVTLGYVPSDSVYGSYGVGGLALGSDGYLYMADRYDSTSDIGDSEPKTLYRMPVTGGGALPFAQVPIRVASLATGGDYLYASGSMQDESNADLYRIDLTTGGVIRYGCYPTPCDPADQDGDGADFGTDCDDEDPFRRPGMLDYCGDGIDTDCDGGDDECTGIGMISVDAPGGQRVFDSDGYLYFYGENGLFRAPPGGGEVELQVPISQLDGIPLRGSPVVLEDDDSVLIDTGDRILRFAPPGTLTTWFEDPHGGGGVTPTNLLVDAAGSIRYRNGQLIFHPSGGGSVFRGSLEEYPVYAEELELIGFDRVYSIFGDAIHRYDVGTSSDGEQWAIFYPAFEETQGLALDAVGGGFFVGGTTVDVPKILYAQHQLEPMVAADVPLQEIFFMAADQDGYLYVAGSPGNGVYRLSFDPDLGEYSGNLEPYGWE